jgi:hypothetical protein
MRKLMEVSYEGLRFVKSETSATVNVYNDRIGKEVYCFTHYEIGDNYTMFREYCIDRYPEIVEDLNKSGLY